MLSVRFIRVEGIKPKFLGKRQIAYLAPSCWVLLYLDGAGMEYSLLFHLSYVPYGRGYVNCCLFQIRLAKNATSSLTACFVALETMYEEKRFFIFIRACGCDFQSGGVDGKRYVLPPRSEFFCETFCGFEPPGFIAAMKGKQVVRSEHFALFF